jgi:hypothetical protein
MDIAFATEQMDRKARQAGRSGALGKHPADAESSIDAIKRAKIEPVEPIVPPFRPATNRAIDISPLPQQMVIDMVMRGLEAISAEALTHILDVSCSVPMGRSPSELTCRRIAERYKTDGRKRYHSSDRLCSAKMQLDRRRKQRLKMRMTKSSIPSIWMSRMTRICS